MLYRLSLVSLLLIASALSSLSACPIRKRAGFVAAPAPKPAETKVQKAIREGVTFLRKIEDGKGDFEHTTIIARIRPGGVTALATVALLQCGVPVDDPLIQRCLKYLRGMPPSQTYTVGLQTMAFCIAGQKEDRQLVQRNLDWLKENRTVGGWGYDAIIKNPDHSINQYALLGIHEAHLAGFKIDRDLLDEMYQFYEKSSGVWNYRGAARPSLTMTTAGLCNLLITAQDLNRKKPLVKGIDNTCGEYTEDVTVAAALKWIARDMDLPQWEAGLVHPFYCLYGIERAGRLTGQRFIGQHDWYRIGCEYLVSLQKMNGSWEGRANASSDFWPPVATSFSLLFLSKGRTPVLISKLAHGDIDPRGNTENWNRKRSDARHVVEFCSRELFERQPLAWQAFDTRPVPIGRKAAELAEDLLQSPIVYITGRTFIGILDKREEKMLKEFVANGGFILGHACCGGTDGDKGRKFDGQFRELIKRITGSELGPLGANHPVWKASGKFKVPESSFGLEGVNVGCKTVVMYIPEPISAYWENNDVDTPEGKVAFQMAANIVAYATGMQIPKPRLTEVEIIRESEGKKPPRGYLQVAQLVTSRGAIPLAPKAIPNLMLELGKLQMEVSSRAEPLGFGTQDLLRYKFLYMHDRVAFRVPAGDGLDNLRFTLEHDGLLLADAACGSKAFDKSFRELVEALWPKDKYPDRQLVPIELKPNQEKNELFSKEVNGTTIESVKYRREEKDGTPTKDYQDGPPRLEGVKINGRWVVIYSKYDIGCALEKHQSTDCLGHDHDSARLLARAAVLYALRR